MRPPKAPKAYDISKLVILVLERHLLIRRLMTDVFREFGVPTISSTQEPDAAFDLFENIPPDIIFCDWTPGLDGLSFVRQVRQSENSPNPFVPIVLLTAHTELHHVCEARDAGMTEFLAKPISAKLVYDRLRMIIENPRPFVRAENFMGPDRRRHTQPLTGEDRRVTQHEAAEADVQPNVH